MLTVVFAGVIVGALAVGVVSAGHNPAVVTIDSSAGCGQTTFTGTVTDPGGTHRVSNMYLVVSVDGQTQSGNIPTDGSGVSITVGPFFEQSVSTKTIQWHVFGGGERSYDDPLWNGFGGPTFGADITNYANSVGGSFSWVIAGPDDPNPFVTWNDVNADSCAITKDMCKSGGWESFGFRNQGQCIRFVETGQDSR
jgi:hypothetical protein